MNLRAPTRSLRSLPDVDRRRLHWRRLNAVRPPGSNLVDAARSGDLVRYRRRDADLLKEIAKKFEAVQFAERQERARVGYDRRHASIVATFGRPIGLVDQEIWNTEVGERASRRPLGSRSTTRTPCQSTPGLDGTAPPRGLRAPRPRASRFLPAGSPRVRRQR